MLERRRGLVRERRSRSDRGLVLERVRERQSRKERPVRQRLHKEQGQGKQVEEHMLALVLELSHKQSEVEQLERKMAEEQQERKIARELVRKTAEELEHMMAEERKKAGEERKIAEKELERKMVGERKTVVVGSKLAEELGENRPVAAGKPK